MELEISPFTFRFDRKQLKVVQEKATKTAIYHFPRHLVRGLKRYIEAGKTRDYLFGMPRRQSWRAISARGSIRYSQRGVQWAVKRGIKKQQNIEKWVFIRSAQFCDASSGRWDGYFKHQNLLGHESIDTTLIYLQMHNFPHKNSFTPL